MATERCRPARPLALAARSALASSGVVLGLRSIYVEARTANMFTLKQRLRTNRKLREARTAHGVHVSSPMGLDRGGRPSTRNDPFPHPVSSFCDAAGLPAFFSTANGGAPASALFRLLLA